MSKQYGLIIPNKDRGHKLGQVSTVKPSVFNDDSDSDTPTTKPTGFTKSVKRQDVLNQKKAIEQDPTVYQYDEIYDKMEQEQKESKLSRKDLEKKPKYISRLLAAADKRKRENERRIERQVQKEREEEGEQFRDKESFVTSAYKKKLEELRELEEQEKREEYLESIGDVTKQGNLDGFYRHLYDQKVNYEDKLRDVKEENDTEVKKEPESNSEDENQMKKPDEQSSPERNQSPKNLTPKKRHSSDYNSEQEGGIKRKKDVKNRKYRARQDSEEEKSDSENETKKEHLPSNLDADSDFSIDSSDSEDETGGDKKQKKKEIPEKVDANDTTTAENGEKKSEDAEVKKEIEKVEEKVEIKPEKPKIDIWKKRTVGEVFDAALKRYYERKALREAGL